MFLNTAGTNELIFAFMLIFHQNVFITFRLSGCCGSRLHCITFLIIGMASGIKHSGHQQGFCCADSSCPLFVLSHPSPAEFVEVLSEVRRVEERLRPFLERTHSILGAATSADYNNNVRRSCHCMRQRTDITSHSEMWCCRSGYHDICCRNSWSSEISLSSVIIIQNVHLYT